MKHVVSVSLGSSRRDKKVSFKLGDETITVERIGCDGDEKLAQALFHEMDGKVDAFGVGGVELYVRVAEKNYALRSGLNLVKQVSQTPYTDGGGLKLTPGARGVSKSRAAVGPTRLSAPGDDAAGLGPLRHGRVAASGRF